MDVKARKFRGATTGLMEGAPRRLEKKKMDAPELV
jgi:hypothetical protein